MDGKEFMVQLLLIFMLVKVEYVTKNGGTAERRVFSSLSPLSNGSELMLQNYRRSVEVDSFPTFFRYGW